METPPTLMSRSESLGRQPATNACAITTERVPDGRCREVGADPDHRRGEGRLVGPPGQPPRLAQQVGVEVGEAVDRHRAVGVVEQDGPADDGGVGADVDAGGVHQPGRRSRGAGRCRGCRW